MTMLVRGTFHSPDVCRRMEINLQKTDEYTCSIADHIYTKGADNRSAGPPMCITDGLLYAYDRENNISKLQSALSSSNFRSHREFHRDIRRAAAILLGNSFEKKKKKKSIFHRPCVKANLESSELEIENENR